MNFKVGDKIVLSSIPKWYGGILQLNEKCTVIKMGFSPSIIWVHNANKQNAPIYTNWASPIPKNQQLLFNFMR